MSEFLYHELSDEEKEQVRVRAKGIMDSFAKKLEAVDESKLGEPIIEREVCERVEGGFDVADIDKEIMFENAPSKNKNFIIAEKGDWAK